MNLSGNINTGLRRVPPWLIYVACGLYIGWQFWMALSGAGRYRIEPINELEREYGETAILLLMVGLLVSPLRSWFGINLMKFRRAIGVSAFFLVLAHFMVWAVLDVRSFGRVWVEMVNRPYVTIGMVSFTLLIPLVITSNNSAVRRMGARAWKQLHKLTYPAAVFAALHYLWLVKGFQWKPVIYMAIIVGLIALRYGLQPILRLDRTQQPGKP